MTAAGVETINLVSTTATATSFTNSVELVAKQATTINVSGDAKVTLTTAAGVADNFVTLNTINASANTAGLTVDLTKTTAYANAVTVTGTAKADTITGGAGADVINAGAGADLVIGSGGADVITLGAGADTYRIIATNAGDTVKDFTAGTGGDVLDYDTAVNGVAGTATAIKFRAVSALGTAFVADSTVIVVTGAAATGTSTAAIATFLDNYGNNHTFEGDDDFLFIVNLGNGNAGVVHFDSGGADNTVTAGELALLATLEGVDTANLVAENFI